jgi:YggT family protein
MDRERHTTHEERMEHRRRERRLDERRPVDPEAQERGPEYPRTSRDARLSEERVVEETPVESYVVEEERVVERHPDRRLVVERRPVVDRLTQAVDYFFFLVYSLLGIRFLLAMLGANESAAFVQLIYGLTNPLYAPFVNIVARPPLNGGVLELPILIAVLGYLLLHMAIRGLVRVIAGPRRVL